jgi:hypothetical protein
MVERLGPGHSAARNSGMTKIGGGVEETFPTSDMGREQTLERGIAVRSAGAFAATLLRWPVRRSKAIGGPSRPPVREETAGQSHVQRAEICGNAWC